MLHSLLAGRSVGTTTWWAQAPTSSALVATVSHFGASWERSTALPQHSSALWNLQGALAAPPALAAASSAAVRRTAACVPALDTLCLDGCQEHKGGEQDHMLSLVMR